MSLIFKKIENFYNESRPFAVYRKPNSEEVSGFFMDENTLQYTVDFTETGFIFAPFDMERKAILFPKEKAEFITEKLLLRNDFDRNPIFQSDISSKEKYLCLVEKAIKNIHKKKIQKVVVSREEIVELEKFKILEIYQKLLKKYKNAFVYVWFHPKVGLWFGATPETLLNTKGNQFKTMSLAGTQVFKGKKDVVWKAKELKEQQLVTGFIEDQLSEIITDLKIDATETVKAGNLLHLCTKVTGTLKKEFSLKTLIRALHPTPAVCGLPRKKAANFIFKNESYDRGFYTGFLGELNIKDGKLPHFTSNLYVNLRCMRIANNVASIYIGAGITNNSDPIKELEETISKSEVMKKVL